MARLPLFPNLPESTPPAYQLKPNAKPVWSENKAQLIQRYLRLFVFITKHGTYIDGFAGPQAPDKTDAWSARMVLESEPKFLRNFYLSDVDPEQVERLEALASGHRALGVPKGAKRRIEVYKGDFNHRIDDILKDAAIRPKEATFCLLDMRTFECEWSTVQKIARHKADGHKIELFYFLANGWLDRSIAALKRESIGARWWGRNDWRKLKGMNAWSRAEILAQRFKTEFGYREVHPWPIWDRGTRRIMYFMVHATDHPEAPKLMRRAYNHLYEPEEPIEQLQLILDQTTD